jgi:hypothetical protein
MRRIRNMPNFAIVGPKMSGVMWEIHRADCQAVDKSQYGGGGSKQHPLRGKGGSNASEAEVVERESAEAASDVLLKDLEDNDTPCGRGDVKLHGCTRPRGMRRTSVVRAL